MNIEAFIHDFSEAIEVDNIELLTAETLFRELDEWDSLAHLSLIAMIDEEYDIQIETKELKKIETLGQLFEAIVSKK